jgi:hypothetical protein
MVQKARKQIISLEKRQTKQEAMSYSIGTVLKL